ncbi:MAG: hypothetical protein ACRDUA_04400, partial [Micromonosporaceae bacterium]
MESRLTNLSRVAVSTDQVPSRVAVGELSTGQKFALVVRRTQLPLWLPDVLDSRMHSTQPREWARDRTGAAAVGPISAVVVGADLPARTRAGSHRPGVPLVST